MPTYVSPTDSRGYYTSLVINEVSQNITNNTTVIYYEYRLHSGPHNHFQDFRSTINLTIDGVTLLNTTTQSVSFSSPFYNTSVLLASGNRTINHNADGTRSISFSSSFRTNSTTTFTPIPTHTITGSLALTTIPRASQPTLDVSSQALGSAITINTNRASASFTHTLKFAFGNQSGTIATGVGASQAWTLPNSLANAIPNATSGSGTITCETYNGSTLIGTRTVAFTATIPNNATFQPNASISSITEGQTGLTAFSVFIQNISRLRVQSTGSGNFSATISQYRVTIDGGHLFGADVTFNPINKNGTLTVTLLVTDSRGYSRTVTQNVTLVAYFTPRINSFSASRSPNDQGTDLSAPINFEIAPVSNQNARYYRVRYRVSGGLWVLLFESSSFYSHTTTHTASGVLNANNSYDVELFVQDSFTSATQTVTVTTAFDLLNFNQSGRGMAIGKVSESNTFEVALPTNFTQNPTVNGVVLENPSLLAPYPVGAIYMSVVDTSPATLFGGTWVKLENQFLVSAGVTFPAGSTGGATTHTHTTPSHTHTVADHTHSIPAHTHPLSQNGYAQVNVTGIGGSFVYLSGRSRPAWAPTDRVTASSYVANTTSQSWGADLAGATDSGGSGNTGSGGSGNTGSGGSGNTGSASTLPPYLSVHMWRRSA